MPPVVQAMATAAALLLPVVIFIVVISIAMVKRGEISMHGEDTHAAPVPATATGKAGAMVPRRAFFSWMGVAWTAFAASMVATASATGRFMFPNVLFEPPATFKAGLPDALQPGKVDERFKQRYGVWLVRDVDVVTGEMGVYALSTV